MAGKEPTVTYWKRSVCLLSTALSLSGLVKLSAAEASAPRASSLNSGNSPVKINTSAPAYFDARAYVLEGDKALTTNLPPSLFSKHTGTNLGIAEIVKAASEVQLACRSQGYTSVVVAIAAHRITNGIVPLDVFRAPVSQILISGRRYSPGGEPMVS